MDEEEEEKTPMKEKKLKDNLEEKVRYIVIDKEDKAVAMRQNYQSAVRFIKKHGGLGQLYVRKIDAIRTPELYERYLNDVEYLQTIFGTIRLDPINGGSIKD